MMPSRRATKVSSPSPPLNTGFAVMGDPFVLQWVVGLLALHLVLHASFSTLATPLKSKPGVAAHQFTIAIPFIYAAVMGVQFWFFDETAVRLHSASYADRMYTHADAPWELCRLMIGLQMYDLLSTGLVPSLRKLEHLAHHASTLCSAIAVASAGGPYMMYCAAFFFGVTEVSSIPLCAVDLFRQIPQLADSKLGAALNEISRATFALSFLPIRCIYFPYVALGTFVPDLIAAYRADDVRSPLVAYYWLWFAIAFLMFLQLFWGYKIVRVIANGNTRGKNRNAMQNEAD